MSDRKRSSARRSARLRLALAALATGAVVATSLLTVNAVSPRDGVARDAQREAPQAVPETYATSLPRAHPATPAMRTALERVVEGRFGPDVPWSGRTATVCGVITRDGRPDPGARVSFTGGANRGVELACDAEGRFASAGLYPGLGIIAVRSRGESVTRELDLAQSHQESWDIDFVGCLRVTGRVTTEAGAPVANARVSVDGQDTLSDSDGWFACDRYASGEPLLLIEATGLVSYRESLRGERLSRPVEVELARGCQLTVSLAPLPDGEGGDDADVYLIPLVQPYSAAGHQASFPWQKLYPLHIAPGSSRVVVGLPATRFEVFAFHKHAKGRSAIVWLQTDAAADVALEWESMPILSCCVTRGGEAVAGVSVSILHADPFRATMRQLGAARQRWRSQPMRILPGVDATAGSTDRTGQVLLPRWGDKRDPGYLVITAEGLTITRLLAADDAELTLDLDDPIAASTAPAGSTPTARVSR